MLFADARFDLCCVFFFFVVVGEGWLVGMGDTCCR